MSIPLKFIDKHFSMHKVLTEKLEADSHFFLCMTITNFIRRAHLVRKVVLEVMLRNFI